MQQVLQKICDLLLFLLTIKMMFGN